MWEEGAGTLLLTRSRYGWYGFSALLKVGTSRCDVPARVQRAERLATLVPRLNGAGTPQRGVPTSLNRCHGCAAPNRYPRPLRLLGQVRAHDFGQQLVAFGIEMEFVRDKKFGARLAVGA